MHLPDAISRSLTEIESKSIMISIAGMKPEQIAEAFYC